jgi:RNA recognition motif-containing protein
MSFTVFLGNLPAWVTADDIKAWLGAENLVADHIKVIRNPETQESKGFAFIDAPNQEEMQSIIKRFDRAPLEDRLLRANPAQPPRGKDARPGMGAPAGASAGPGYDRPSGDRGSRDRRPARRPTGTSSPASGQGASAQTGNSGTKSQGGNKGGAQSAFAEELAKAL